jgi:hypothetical protein
MHMFHKEDLPMARMQRGDAQSPRMTIPASNAPTPDPRQRHQRIAEAAYHRWQKRGADHGGDHQDWLDAESEVDGKG